MVAHSSCSQITNHWYRCCIQPLKGTHYVKFAADIVLRSLWAQFTGTDNAAHAPPLTRQLLLSSNSTIDLDAIAHSQVMDLDIDQLRRDSSYNLAAAPIITSQNTILCDISQGSPTPMVPAAHRYSTVLVLHNLGHSGLAASVKLVTEKFESTLGVT